MGEKQVYILLTNTGSLLTRLIKLFTKKPYNHASVSFDSGLSEVYSFGRKKPRNPFVGGFVREDVKSGLFKQAECAIYSHNVTESETAKMKDYIRQIESEEENYGYNFLGLFGFLFGKPIKRKKAFFCSQFVASVLKESSMIDFERPPELITPNDLQKISELQRVYEGDLKGYHKGSEDEEECIPVPFLSVKV